MLQICLDENRYRSGFFDQFGGLPCRIVILGVMDADDGDAVLGERLGDGPANTPGRSGD
jgi:hypothetical protein